MFSVAIKKPAALVPGDKIRLVAPASPFNRSRLERGRRIIERMGFVPVVDRKEFSSSGFLAGADEKRAQRIQQALLEEETRAVWCIRGGYGSARLLGNLELDRLKRNPKLLIGFSDITALLVSLSSPGGFVTMHAPVVTQLGRVTQSARDWLEKLMTSADAPGKVHLGQFRKIHPGRIRGFLTGGNLALLASLVGTPYLPSLAGAILFIEDTDEQAYRLDRMFNQLVQAGVLKNIFGVVIGSLAGCKPAGRGRHSARSVLERAVATLGVPAVSGADFGHIARNMAMPLGVLAELDANRRTLSLLEPAVS